MAKKKKTSKKLATRENRPRINYIQNPKGPYNIMDLAAELRKPNSTLPQGIREIIVNLQYDTGAKTALDGWCQPNDNDFVFLGIAKDDWDRYRRCTDMGWLLSLEVTEDFLKGVKKTKRKKTKAKKRKTEK